MGARTVVVGLAWPPRLTDELVTMVSGVEAGIEVLPCPFEQDGALRHARSRHAVDETTRAAARAVLTAELRAALERVEVLLAFDVPFDLVELAPRLRWVQVIGSGYEHFWGSGLERATVTVTNAVGTSAVSMAEFVMGRILEHWKRFGAIRVHQQRHEWVPEYGRLLAGATIGIVGLGAIGSAVAERARAFGMRVLAIRRSYPGRVDERVDELMGPGDLHRLLAASDVVVLCAPSTPQTRHLLDAPALAAMRPGSVLVNVARGTLIDEPALVDALERGHLAAAILDVVADEPLAPDHPLWDAPNVTISAHCSATSERYAERVYALFAENLGRYVRGEPLRNVVDPAAV